MALVADCRLFMIGGYIVIQSIFRISINDKIQSYGQLRTIGATPKQIKPDCQRTRDANSAVIWDSVLAQCWAYAAGLLLFSSGF